MDSNHDKGLQRALCYHYTIGQARVKLSLVRRRAKEKLQGEFNAAHRGSTTVAKCSPVCRGSTAHADTLLAQKETKRTKAIQL
jgi:hypothetical protein